MIVSIINNPSFSKTMREYTIGKYLKQELDKSRQYWDSFAKLVHHLADLQNQGYLLSDKKSRAGHTYQFKMKNRIIELKPKFLNKLKRNIRDLVLSPFQNENISIGFNTITLYNNHFMYAPNKGEKINLPNLKKLVVQKGVIHHLNQYFQSTSPSRLRVAEAEKYRLQVAKANCSLTNRNFPKLAQKHLKISQEELEFLV